ncbi:MAG: sel1 repeat family protein [Bacteroidales bacterium]|nr:sel1 repeat family protein [Bacteroidales bacterium]MCM1146767.1 sel1 repeat family protein [Bacteroidales bacterium]MCM1205736.1 sel1 repeat family protein [Bacillota bacterium]MCM1510734.1 sel1 repeat family protein [Clostridium sp.]
MKSDNKGLSECFKIIRQFIRCHAGEGDAASARQAVEAITPAAEYGDVKAQMLLGKYYSWGYHNECDNQKAIHWFEKAADNGNAEAAMLIMEIYRNDCPDGIDAEQRKALILKWHRRWFDILATKADSGSADAAKDLMNLYIEECPEDMTQDDGLAEALKWYYRWIKLLTAKAERGDSMDKWNLAEVLLYGDCAPEKLLDCFTDEDDERKLSQAIVLYKEVTADSQFLMKHKAYFRMGCAYNDLGLWKEALACFKKAAKLNWHEAYAKIGEAYRYGKGVDPDDATARRWYKKGAGLGEITAMLRLAECYKNGIGGAPDYEKAMLEYQYIAERLNGRGFKHQTIGIGTALYELGNMYLNGLGVQPNLKEALRYFKLAVKKCNNPLAENKLQELL